MTDSSSPLSLSKSPTAISSDGHDVFISHASEDKKKVARPLAKQLENLGLRVWLDETEIVVGDSLRAVIDRGLKNSRFGVVILSPSFFRKSWTQYELDGLLAKSDGTRKIILPVWHKVTKNEVASFSLGLAGLAAVSTDLGIKEVANQISRAILRDPVSIPRPVTPPHWAGAVSLRRLATALIASTIMILAAPGLYLWHLTSTAEPKEAEPIVASKVPEPAAVDQPPVQAKPRQSKPASTTTTDRRVLEPDATQAPQPSQALGGLDSEPSREFYTRLPVNSANNVSVVKFDNYDTVNQIFRERKAYQDFDQMQKMLRAEREQRAMDDFRRMQETQKTLNDLRRMQQIGKTLIP